MRTDQRQIGLREPVAGGLLLVPERVDERRAADLLQPVDLFVRELELGSGEVVRELLVGASADNHGGDAGAVQQPCQRDPGRRYPSALSYLHQHLDRVIELLLVVDRWLIPVARLSRA